MARWSILAAGAGAMALGACVSPNYATHAPAGRTASGPPRPAPGAVPPANGQGRYKVGKPYQVAGRWYYPAEQPNYDETGIASWYGDAFHAKATANGEVFDMGQLTAAHKTLPMPSIVEVTNLENGRTLQVRVNDRGPFVDGRIIDLSRAAANELGMLRAGVARVRVRYIGPAPLDATVPPTLLAAAPPKRATPEPKLAVPAYEAPPIVALNIPEPLVTVDVAPPPSPFGVQVGAFSDPGRAQQLSARLADLGQARIVPVQRDGATLYRVILGEAADEGEAWALRERAVAAGVTDARVVRP